MANGAKIRKWVCIPYKFQETIYMVVLVYEVKDVYTRVYIRGAKKELEEKKRKFFSTNTRPSVRKGEGS